ncbi:glutathione peroxidase [Pollutimonas subterranea]|uniref:Glutathione peroxidase n=1 Tax=Pollutimonas subterranea TaxID=2045210 RepID=A0A2N4U7T0_9BURK|nr:glutathione peroxidase [Pollutimonas subterranea]PLC51062.1 glutathione peroxidase [Pollutimonas subterranea]
MTTIYSFSAQTLHGDHEDLSRYRGQVLLVVNVASQCGFTPQYQGLESLYREYHERGFSVLGFPCDQFGHQEPGSAQEIANFCSSNYEISFPMFDKIEVNGPGAHPLFAWLKGEKSGVLGTRAIKWNFTKFLVGRDGRVLQRYGSTTKPDALRNDIEEALNVQAASPETT